MFMSSGHWTNTGMARFINDNLYNYNSNNEKSMNPFRWYRVQNGEDVSNYRETINGFPCRLILINDGSTPLNEGQNEPTPGNTKDMGIFNFNNDKDNVTTLGFDSDIFPNCASYEVTANSDTSAGAFMSYNVELWDGKWSDGYLTSNKFNESTDGKSAIIKCEENHEYIVKKIGGNRFRICFFAEYPTADSEGDSNNRIQNDTLTESTVICPIGYPYMVVTVYYGTTFGDVDLTIVDNSNEFNIDELAYIKESFELRHPDEDDVEEGWGFMGVGEEGTGLKTLIDWVDNCTDEEFVADFEEHFHKDYTLRYFCLVTLIGAVDNLGGQYSCRV